MSTQEQASAKIVVIGDVCGKFPLLISRIEKLHKSIGPIQGIFCVGQFFGTSESDISFEDAFKDYIDGVKTLPVPLYFITTNTTIMPSSSKITISTNEKKLCPNVTYLGDHGVTSIQIHSSSSQTTKPQSIQVGFLSGTSSTHSMIVNETRFKNILRQTSILPHGLDLLLTNTSGKGVFSHCDSSLYPTKRILPQSNGKKEIIEDITDITQLGSSIFTVFLRQCLTQYHFSGNEGFYATVPPFYSQANLSQSSQTQSLANITRFYSLAPLGNSLKLKDIFACNLQLQQIDGNVTDVTLNPYSFILQNASKTLQKTTTQTQKTRSTPDALSQENDQQQQDHLQEKNNQQPQLQHHTSLTAVTPTSTSTSTPKSLSAADALRFGGFQNIQSSNAPNVTGKDGKLSNFVFRDRFSHLEAEQREREKAASGGSSGNLIRFEAKPKPGYICKICGGSDHFIQLCPKKIQQSENREFRERVRDMDGNASTEGDQSGKRHRTDRDGEGAEGDGKNKRHCPPEGYTCKLCNIPGHWIQDCSLATQKDSSDRPSRVERGEDGEQATFTSTSTSTTTTDSTTSTHPKQECWFCLSSSAVATHLVASVGDESYIALPRGPITTGHVLLLPTEHVENYATVSSAVYEEVQKYIHALRTMYLEVYNKDTLVYERYIRIGNGTKSQHMQMQIIPIDRLDAVDTVDAEETTNTTNNIDPVYTYMQQGVNESIQRVMETIEGKKCNYNQICIREFEELEEMRADGVEDAGNVQDNNNNEKNTTTTTSNINDSTQLAKFIGTVREQSNINTTSITTTTNTTTPAIASYIYFEIHRSKPINSTSKHFRRQRYVIDLTSIGKIFPKNHAKNGPNPVYSSLLELPRWIVCHLLQKQDRIDWKNILDTVENETIITDKFKEKFEPYDFAMDL